ncbi:MAG: N-acetyl-gamma-glutamyl-phosphate reductase, partial [Paramuribaculum sp.]|nr:N-acetyl-gamma-glutamyl-phosphate reductase [Paramuribaculum sp.]
TALQLSMLPLAAAGLLPDRISVSGVPGSTGAGVKPGATTHFSWRSDNLSVYKPFNHQHLAEIRRSLQGLQNGWNGTIDFVPVRGNFARGIYAMTWIHTDMTEEAARKLYTDFYATAPFTVVAPGEVDLKQAVNTNKAVIGIAAVEGRLLITCAIDNLLKGASGQAVQNMNIMAGFDETAGLRLKPSAF